MSATSDNSAFRHLRLFVETSGQSEKIELARSLEARALRAALQPSESLLNELLTAVVAPECSQHSPVTAVRIEVWRTEFSGEPLTATDRRLCSFVRAMSSDQPNTSARVHE